MALNKKDLLKTATEVEEVEIEALEGETVKIRRLRDGEYNEIQEKTLEGLNIKNNLSREDFENLKDAEGKQEKAEILNSLGMDIDIKKLTKMDKEADYLACKYGLSVNEEKWEIEEVKQLPTGVPGEIADKIFEITNVDVEEEELEPFREE